jgi:two-component system cell cycle sensor histidine kinase/response regulator CckA
MKARTILLVEDNPITRKMLRFALDSEGYDVIDAADGQSALEACAARAPDVVVLDYVLPDMNGLQLLGAIRKQAAREVPAIMVTGMVSRLAELRRRGGVATQFVAKPVEPSRLLEIVRLQLAAPSAKAGGRLVLVVDDDPLNRKLATFRLKQAGYEVELASGGQEALRQARSRPPDGILSDVLMPGMDGFALCQEIRGDPALDSVPVVLVSAAYVDEADRELARKMGANALVVRTSDLRDAIVALEQALELAAPPPLAPADDRVAALHRERLQVQLERQTAVNEALLRQAAVQATALSIIRGLAEVMAQPKDVSQILGDVLVHCLDAAGLSTGLLYVAEAGGSRRLQAQFGITANRRADAETGFGHPELLQRVVEGRVAVAFSSGAGADPETQDFLARLGHSSALIVPFVVLGETFGELVLASDTHDLSESAWTSFARSLALQFGQTVALGQSLKRTAESEARYRALMEHASDSIFGLDAQGVILEANREAETLLGVPREQIVGRHISAFAPSPTGEPPEYVGRFVGALAARGGLIDNVVLQRGDGTLVEVDFSMSVNDVGGKAYVLSIGHDVTQRNRAAAALRDAQKRLHHVVTSNPAVLYSLRPEGQRLLGNWISANVERLLGYSAEEALDPDWFSSNLHPDDRDRVIAESATILDTGYLPQEYRFRHKRGRYIWLRAELRLLRDPDRNPVEVVGSWSDVTARKEVELRLQESEEKYRLLFDSNPHPMWVYDQETLAFLAVNDAALRHYGYSREEFLGMTALDIRPAEEVASFKKEYEEYLAQHGGDVPFYSQHTFKHRKKDGTIIEVDIAANPILFEGRKAWLLLATDVTEKRSLEAQLLQAQKIESMGRLAGGVAHDFNNLLGVISGYGTLLQQKIGDTPRLKKYVDDILKASERAAGLTRQLLAFSRKQVLQPRILDLNAVVGEVEKMLRRLIGEDVQLVTILDEHLGSVKADPGQVEQILMNLAVNARDAMPRGGRLTIETSNVDLDRTYARLHPGVEPGLYALLAVSDTGHGMTPEVRARAFEPFFTTKEAGKGTGLGLATVHGIVKQSGGHIWLYSEPGQGTSFKIYLPRIDEPEEPAETPVPEAPLPRGTETILLVEDEASLRELVRECLEATGYTVLEARHGAEAIAICEGQSSTIGLVITDVVMPGMSGRELAEQLRGSRPDIQVLYMSGYTDDAVVVHGVMSAEMAFIQKPFTAAALARKVRELLDKAAADSSGP